MTLSLRALINLYLNGAIMFLAVDTVFDQCSVAVVDQNFQVLSSHTKTGKREQTQQILPMIDTALQQAAVKLSDLTALIFNRGPGPFSGIRINTAVVQALSVAHDIPCVGVSSLAAIAQRAYDQHGVKQVYAALDARMKQVYFGEYQLRDLSQINDLQCHHDSELQIMVQVEGSEERLVDYDQATANTAIAIAGNGASLLDASAQQDLYGDINPDATILATLGIVQYKLSGGVAAAEALPVYLRNNAWKTLKEQGKS